MIGLIPPRLTWPSPILEGPFREIARANLTIVTKEGICLTNIHRLKPDRESVDDYASLLGTLQAFAHLVGGDFCANVRNAKTDDGFKTDFVVQASLFDPKKVKVWPVINTVFERVVQLRLLRPLIEKVLPIVAGKNDMNEVEAMLVQAVTKLYPDPMSVNIDVGKLISKGIELARKKIGGRRTRRLEGSEEGGSWISEEGMFDLGHIPPSDRLDGGFEGSGKACGWKCGTFKSDGTFGPAPDKPDYAKNMTNLMTNLTCATVNAGLPFNCSNETNAIDANPTNITCLSQLKCTSTECCTVVATTTILTSTLIIIIVCSSVVFIGIIIAVVVVVKKGITSKKKELTKVTPANVKSNTKKTKNKNKKKTKSKNKMENKKTVVLSAKQKGSVASWEAPGETSKRETLKFLDT